MSQNKSEKYEVVWKRAGDKLTPEEEIDAKHREEAVNELLSDLEVDGEIEYKHPKLLLAEPSPHVAYTVAELIIENPETVVIVVEYIRQKIGDEVEVDEEIKDVIDERLEDDRDT